MLKSWDAVIHPTSGKIQVSIGGQEHPIRIDDQDLFLPLSEILDRNTAGKVFFHPACENITSKETEVFKVIRKITVMKLLSTFNAYTVILAPISNKKPKKAWRNDVVNILSPLKGVKKSVIEEVARFFSSMQVEVEDDRFDRRMVHIKVTKPGGRSRGTGNKVYYVAKPVFPLYNELAKVQARLTGTSPNQLVDILDTQVTMEALDLILHMFEVCMPGVSNPDDYMSEATEPTAARLSAYLNCYSLVAEDLNSVQNHFRKEFIQAGVTPIYLDWLENMESLPEIWRQVPTMDYNSHNTQSEVSVANNAAGQMFDISSNSNSNNAANNNVDNNTSQRSNTVTSSNIVNTHAGEFDISQPQMLNGDTPTGNYEIDYNTLRVKHYANSNNGQVVVYHCSRQGNLLTREIQQPGMNMMNNNMMNNNNIMGNGMNQQQMMMIQAQAASMGVSPEQLIHMRMMQASGMPGNPTAGSSVSSVRPNSENNQMFSY